MAKISMAVLLECDPTNIGNPLSKKHLSDISAK